MVHATALLPIRVKGVAVPVAVYELTTARARRVSRQASSKKMPALVVGAAGTACAVHASHAANHQGASGSFSWCRVR